MAESSEDAARRLAEEVDLSSEIHARCHEGRWFRRAKELEQERDEARAEYQRVTEISDDDAWVFDVPGDDKACVAEYRIRWLRVKILLSAALAREKGLREALEKLTPCRFAPSCECDTDHDLARASLLDSSRDHEEGK